MKAPWGPQPCNSKTAAMDPKLDSVRKITAALVGEQGIAKALKRARSELRHARRARSRKLYGFWAAVEAELEAARLDAERASTPLAAVVAEPPRAAAPSPAFASAGEPRTGAMATPGPRSAAGEVWTSTARSS